MKLIKKKENKLKLPFNKNNKIKLFHDLIVFPHKKFQFEISKYK